MTAGYVRRLKFHEITCMHAEYYINNVYYFSYVTNVILYHKSNICMCFGCKNNNKLYLDNIKKYGNNISIEDQYLILKNFNIDITLNFFGLFNLISCEENLYHTEVIDQINYIIHNYIKQKSDLTSNLGITDNDREEIKKIIKNQFYQNKTKKLYSIIKLNMLLGQLYPV